MPGYFKSFEAIRHADQQLASAVKPSSSLLLILTPGNFRIASTAFLIGFDRQLEVEFGSVRPMYLKKKYHYSICYKLTYDHSYELHYAKY